MTLWYHVSQLCCLYLVLPAQGASPSVYTENTLGDDEDDITGPSHLAFNNDEDSVCDADLGGGDHEEELMMTESAA